MANILAAVRLHALHPVPALHRDATGGPAPEREAADPGPHPGLDPPGSTILEKATGKFTLHVHPAVKRAPAADVLSVQQQDMSEAQDGT